MTVHRMEVWSYSSFTLCGLNMDLNLGSGTCSGTGGSGGWLCQHRYVAISGMVGFRNNVTSAKMSDWVSPQSDRIAFGRGTHHFLWSGQVGQSELWLGSRGYVAINNDDVSWAATFSTSLPDDTYCDVISGWSSGGQCTGKTYVYFWSCGTRFW